MKIARDFITGEMSVNKNEYARGEAEAVLRSFLSFRPRYRRLRRLLLIPRHRFPMPGDSKVRSRARRVNLVV